jgi:hypothetical protein
VGDRRRCHDCVVMADQQHRHRTACHKGMGLGSVPSCPSPKGIKASRHVHAHGGAGARVAGLHGGRPRTDAEVAPGQVGHNLTTAHHNTVQPDTALHSRTQGNHCGAVVLQRGSTPRLSNTQAIPIHDVPRMFHSLMWRQTHCSATTPGLVSPCGNDRRGCARSGKPKEDTKPEHVPRLGSRTCTARCAHGRRPDRSLMGNHRPHSHRAQHFNEQAHASPSCAGTKPSGVHARRLGLSPAFPNTKAPSTCRHSDPPWAARVHLHAPGMSTSDAVPHDPTHGDHGEVRHSNTSDGAGVMDADGLGMADRLAVLRGEGDTVAVAEGLAVQDLLSLPLPLAVLLWDVASLGEDVTVALLVAVRVP